MLRFLLFVVLFVYSIKPIEGLICFHCENSKEFPQRCSYFQNETEALMPCDREVRHCYTYLDQEQRVVARGCYDKYFPQCNKEDPNACILCNTPLCNKKQFIQETCVGMTKIEICPETTFKYGGCISWAERFSIGRQCLANVVNQRSAMCLNNKCRTCYGDLCNKKGPQKCYICQSSHGDHCRRFLDTSMIQKCDNFRDQCYIKQMEPQKCYSCHGRKDKLCGQFLTTELIISCQNFIDHCYTLAAGHEIYRGCQYNEDSVCKNPEGCDFCADNLCNDRLFKVVMDCYNCHSQNTSTCFLDQTLTSNMHHCDMVTEFNKCYTYYSEQYNITVRGCLTDINEFTRRCNSEPEHCLTCDHNECNWLMTFGAPKLACVQCQETDAQCAVNQLADPVYTMCQKQTIVVRKEQCFKYPFDSGGIRYGCINDEPDFCKDKECDICDSAMCNYVAFINQKCVQCNSTNQLHCADSPHLIPGRICPDPNNFGHLGCYAYKDDDKIVHRGCTNELNFKVSRTCMFEEGDQCLLCNGENCNRDLFMSRSSRKFPSYVIVICFYLIKFI